MKKRATPNVRVAKSRIWGKNYGLDYCLLWWCWYINHHFSAPLCDYCTHIHTAYHSTSTVWWLWISLSALNLAFSMFSQCWSLTNSNYKNKQSNPTTKSPLLFSTRFSVIYAWEMQTKLWMENRWKGLNIIHCCSSVALVMCSFFGRISILINVCVACIRTNEHWKLLKQNVNVCRRYSN